MEEQREELVGADAEAGQTVQEPAERGAHAPAQVDELASLRRELEAARTQTAEQARQMAQRYRAVLLQTAPEVPPELVQGESIDELDRSLARARDVVARVREQVQAQAAAHVPIGSPVRGGVNLDGLSPAELIRTGISERGVRG